MLRHTPNTHNYTFASQLNIVTGNNLNTCSRDMADWHAPPLGAFHPRGSSVISLWEVLQLIQIATMITSTNSMHIHYLFAWGFACWSIWTAVVLRRISYDKCIKINKHHRCHQQVLLCKLLRLVQALTTELESGTWKKRTTTWHPNSQPSL